MIGYLEKALNVRRHEFVPALLLSLCAFLDQQEFYDAMAEDFNLTRGILRALARTAPASP